MAARDSGELVFARAEKFGKLGYVIGRKIAWRMTDRRSQACHTANMQFILPDGMLRDRQA
jgi:hypothetical protein